MIYNIAEAKAHLSTLIQRAYQGEEIIIAKNNLPLVELIAHRPKSKVILGLLKDRPSSDALLSALDIDDSASWTDNSVFPQ